MSDDAMVKAWKPLLAELGGLIERDFGERCPDRSATCAICVAWRAYDDLVDLAGIEPDPFDGDQRP